MEHCHPSAAKPRARKPRQSTADYRWTQPKVIAFLEALSQSGRVADAARAVGMSAWSAYRLHARLGSARFAAAFEGARKSGIRARAAASRERLVAAERSRWEGLGLGEMIAREREFALSAQGAASPSQGGNSCVQGAAAPAQGGAPAAQGDGSHPQGGRFPRKVTKNSPGPCNTRSMSRGTERG